jgi:phage baseplate assembly protein W
MSEKIFYSIPFRAEKLIRQKVGEPAGRLEKCDAETSIQQNLRLLLLTAPMRVRFAPIYGCKVHWLQFMASNRAMQPRSKLENHFKMQIEENVKLLVGRFEPRLHFQEAQVRLEESTNQTDWKLTAARRTQLSVIKLTVTVKGEIHENFSEEQKINLEDNIPLL